MGVSPRRAIYDPNTTNVAANSVEPLLLNAARMESGTKMQKEAELGHVAENELHDVVQTLLLHVTMFLPLCLAAYSVIVPHGNFDLC
ncbi:Nucleolar pre-ribosomal-associated protein 1 [Sesbania bispinosa]|nr:Nucleolar pre-ribosomal-associated protein 1 [Sesbania bispinosa]